MTRKGSGVVTGEDLGVETQTVRQVIYSWDQVTDPTINT